MIKGNRKYKYNKKEKPIVDRLIEFQKQQENNLIKSFWKGIRISKYTTPDEINERVLTFAKKSQNAKFIRLADFQLKDMHFMSRLYKTNVYTTRYFYPQASMYKNHKYLLDFINLSYKRKQLENKEIGLPEPSIETVLYSVLPALENVEFVVRLFEIYNKENALKVLSNCYKRNVNSLIDYGKQEKAFNDMVESLPMEFVANQVQNFGVDALEYLPEDYTEMLSMVVEAVEIDGFKAIGYLSADEILANKFLLYRSYDLFGVKGLLDFLRYDLSGYCLHYKEKCGQTYSFSYFSEDARLLRNQILADDRIRKIILEEYNNSKNNKYNFSGFIDRDSGELVAY